MKSKILSFMPPLAPLTLALLMLSSLPVVSQVQTGSILVRAVDEQGAAIPGVTITSPMLVAGQMVGITDGGGAYRFPSLPNGTYTVKLEMQGFQTPVRDNVVVSVGQTTPLELVMKIGSVEETVTVTAESPTVDTTSANVSVTLDQNVLQRTPGGRDVWALVEHKVPGLVIQRPDVGGTYGGQQARMTAKGSPSSENTQFLNGINVGNPGFPGIAGYYYDYDAFEEVQVSTGAHDISVSGSGVFLNMVTKSGTDRFAGKASYYYQGDPTQGTNVDENLKQFGFSEDAGSTDLISDAGFQLGGPVVREKLRFFSSFRDNRIHVVTPGFPEITETNMTSGLVNLTWQANERNRVTGFYSWQKYQKPNRGANANETPETTRFEDDRFWIAQGLWNSALSDNAFMDARVSYLSVLFPALQKGNDQSLFDLSTGRRLRSASSGFIFTWPRLQASANFNYFVDRALGGRHEFRFGVDYSHAASTADFTRIDDLNLTYRSATNAASTVTLYNSPVNSRTTVDEIVLFLQDSYSVGRFTLTGGVRWAGIEGYLPEQSSPPSQWFPDLPREFSAVRDIVDWKTLSPRVSAVYDLLGDGKTALRAAAGRYHYALSTSTPNAVNPNFTVSETYGWNDLNGDLRFQTGEQGALLSRAGGNVSTVDSDIKRPYTDELVVGVGHELIPDVALSANFTYRLERERIGSVDIGVPFSAYRPVDVTDIGRDGLPGTADDAIISVWAQDPDTLGENRFVTTNSSAFNQTYRGLELIATKRFRNRWQMLAAYTLSRAIENAEPGTLTPNSLINSRGPTHADRTHVFKLTGTWVLPSDVAVSGNLRSQTGGVVADEDGQFTSTGGLTRNAVFRLTQGNVNVNVEPRGSDRMDTLTTIDARVSKTFRLGGDRSLAVMLDIYNLANTNTVWAVRTLTGRVNVSEGGTGEAINQPSYNSPTFIVAPRVIRLGVSFQF